MGKEKLEEAKRLYETANADQRYVLESLFPELKESDDEKVRKVLLKYFNCYKEVGTIGAETFNGVPTDNILAWLEKQGETFTKKDIDDTYLKGVCDAKKELEKQGKSSLQWKRIKKGEHLPEKSVVMTEDGTILPFGTEGGIEVGQDVYYLPVRELSILPKQGDKL